MLDAILSDYFYGDEAEQFVYFRIPRQLITAARFKCISTDSKLLYGMLLDRMGLSVKNKWHDDDGRVFIYYTVEEICGDMNCGRDKAMKLLSELDTAKGVGLIERIKQGQGKPTKIYVKRFTTQAIQPQNIPRKTMPNSEVDFPDAQKSGFPTSRGRDCRRAVVEEIDPNYNNLNQPNFNYPDPSIYPTEIWTDRCELREKVKANIDYDRLKEQFPYDDVESLLELIVDVLSSNVANARIGKEILPMATVKQRFLQLDSGHITYVVNSLKQTTTNIRNIRAYLLTALYNAPVTISPYYSAMVRYDYG